MIGEQFSWGPSHKEIITGINNNLPRCKYRMCGYLHLIHPVIFISTINSLSAQNLSSLTLLMLSLSPPTSVDQFQSLLHSSPQRCNSPVDDNTVTAGLVTRARNNPDAIQSSVKWHQQWLCRCPMILSLCRDRHHRTTVDNRYLCPYVLL